MVSVILPVYNCERYISQAIESILNQTYDDFELIIINDGSTDNTKDKILSFDDKRIRYIGQDNKGPSVSRNVGIDLSRGEFIALIDADDYYGRDKLKVQLDALTAHPEADVAYCAVEMVAENGTMLRRLEAEYIFERREDFLAMLLFRQIIIPATVMLRKSCFENGMRYNKDYIHAEDYDFTIKLAGKHSFLYVDEALYFYRRHACNLSNQTSLHLANERRIIKDLGYEKIDRVISLSNFSRRDKTLLRAKIYYKIADYEKSCEVLNELDGLTADDICCFYLGNICLYAGNPEEARRYYLLSLAANPDMPEAYNNLGVTYIRTGLRDEGLKCFQRALDIKGDYLDAAYNLDHSRNGRDYRITDRELRRCSLSYDINTQ